MRKTKRKEKKEEVKKKTTGTVIYRIEGSIKCKGEESTSYVTGERGIAVDIIRTENESKRRMENFLRLDLVQRHLEDVSLPISSIDTAVNSQEVSITINKSG